MAPRKLAPDQIKNGKVINWQLWMEFIYYMELWGQIILLFVCITVPHGNVNFISGEITKKPFQSRDENLVLFDKNHRDQTERYFL